MPRAAVQGALGQNPVSGSPPAVSSRDRLRKVDQGRDPPRLLPAPRKRGSEAGAHHERCRSRSPRRSALGRGRVPKVVRGAPAGRNPPSGSGSFSRELLLFGAAIPCSDWV